MLSAQRAQTKTAGSNQAGTSKARSQCTVKSMPSLEWKMLSIEGVNMKDAKSEQALVRKEKRRNGAVNTRLKDVKTTIQSARHDDLEEYSPCKTENITYLVAI